MWRDITHVDEEKWLVGEESNLLVYRAFSRGVLSAMLVYLNNEKSAMLVSQINPVGVELFCNAKTFFCFIKQI